MLPLNRFSFFLTPCNADFVHYEALIRELGAACAAPPFEPHITVYSGVFTDPDVLKRAASAAVEGMGPFSLKVTGIGCSMEYFKSISIEFEESAVLHGIHDRLKRGIDNDSGYRLIPHLSLLYSDKPLEEKEPLVPSINLPRQEIFFDRVKIVVPQNSLQGWRDTGAWLTLFSKNLGGPDRCGQ